MVGQNNKEGRSKFYFKVCTVIEIKCSKDYTTNKGRKQIIVLISNYNDRTLNLELQTCKVRGRHLTVSQMLICGNIN